MSGRLFIGPAGSELIGSTNDGTPVVADENGAGAMREITRFVNVDPWPFMGIRAEEGTE